VQRLADAERPIPRFELIFASRRERLSYHVRCRIPVRLKIAWAELLGRLDRWRSPDLLDEARKVNEPIIAGTRWQAEGDELARRRLVDERVREAGFWRTHWDRDPVVGLEHMHAALAEGRGVIVTFAHTGCMFGTFAPLWTEARRITYISTGSWFFDEPDGSDWSFRVEHWRRGLRESEGRIVCMGGSFGTLRALLERGEVVMIAFDMPGSKNMRFLGKEVALASGTAVAARETDSLVLPVRRRRRGLGLEVEFTPALDPRDYPDAGALQEALAAHHERWILERPASFEDPTRLGAWESGARPDAWVRPPR
jgi:Bacterial lipid A biosynthesis acyltransferase